SIHLYHQQQSHSLFFFNHPATTEIYTLSLHDALPIFSISITPINSSEAALMSSCLVSEENFTLPSLTLKMCACAKVLKENKPSRKGYNNNRLDIYQI